MAATKPPLPGPLEPFERVAVDQADGGAFDTVLQLAAFAVALRMGGPHAPDPMPRTPVGLMRFEVREALLYLLELGLIDIDEERLAAGGSWPAMRDPEAAS